MWRKIGDTPDMTISVGTFQDGRQTKPMCLIEINILLDHIAGLRNKEINDEIEKKLPTLMCDINFWQKQCTTKY